MNWFRIRHTIGLSLARSGQRRAKYIKKHGIFYHMGDNCMVMFRKIPLYPKLISIGNNVWIASNVLLITHDVIHKMLNNSVKGETFREAVGCIEINDNVFVGSNTTILPNVTIGSNTVIAAGSLVNRSIPGNGVYGGVPAKYICTLNELIARRRNALAIEIVKDSNGNISAETVEAIWNYYKKQKTGGCNEQ